MQNKVLVWDKWVRTSHWLVAGLFFINAFLTEEGDEIHRYLGYAILAIMCIRWIWGFIGTQYARFSSFFPTPQQIVLHIKHIHDGEKHGLGHNPFAAMMIFALWGVMSALIVSGWMMTLDQFWGEEWVEELHEWLVNMIYVMVFIHATAAILESFLQKDNLIAAMIHGKKKVKLNEQSSKREV